MIKTFCCSTLFVAAMLMATTQTHAQTVRQTTFNCPDWQQGSGSQPCASNDWIREWGDWFVSGYPDEITSAANNPSGAGGKGYRHYRLEGRDRNGGGLIVRLPQPEPEVWWRIFVPWEAGFAWVGGRPQYAKDVWWNIYENTTSVISGFDYGRLRVYVSGSGGIDLKATGTFSSMNGGPTGDGQWHLIEGHYRTDTNGQNGIVELWLDGQQEIGRNDINFGGALFSVVGIGSNQNEVAPGSGHYTDYDDLEISTAGFGSSTGASPAPPTNLRIVSQD